MIIFFSVPVFPQEASDHLPEAGEQTAKQRDTSQGVLAASPQRGDFWICPGVETAFYSYSGVSVGGSLSAAYGNKASVGIKTAWFFDTKNELDTLELNFLLRYYFTGGAAGAPSAGPYLQLTAGPALFFEKTETVSMPAKWGTMSAGLTFGWRFFLGKLFFAEPYIRAGYPYLAGAGISGGVRF